VYYSGGKKKKHTIKNQIMVNNQGYIIHKTDYKKGRRHDYDIYKKNHPVIPKQVVNVFDLGYLSWCRKGFPGTKIIITVQKEAKSRVVTRSNGV
jgi:hypothetical protein